MKVNNKQFKRKYNRIFRKDPAAANLFLLITELADQRGQVKTDENELADLMAVRFADPRGYSL